jgi:hypothetical protein
MLLAVALRLALLFLTLVAYHSLHVILYIMLLHRYTSSKFSCLHHSLPQPLLQLMLVAVALGPMLLFPCTCYTTFVACYIVTQILQADSHLLLKWHPFTAAADDAGGCCSGLTAFATHLSRVICNTLYCYACISS